jgi:hypothetical protein
VFVQPLSGRLFARTSLPLALPTVSRFFGIVVFLNYNDHTPPHFHARYGDDEVTVEIHGGAVTGTMSKRALRLVLEWAEIHEEALMRNWTLARERRPLEQIPPLT